MDELDADARARLLAAARCAIAAAVQGGAPPEPPAGGPFEEPRGVFVSLHTRAGELRGCLGRITADVPLGRAVTRLAAASATSDRRFEPVRPDELPALDIEISVLSPPEPCRALADVIVGRDGLIVRQGGRSGLLLPQVAAQRGWDAATFVRHTCRKAGLAEDAWPAHAALERFQAHVFHAPMVDE